MRHDLHRIIEAAIRAVQPESLVARRLCMDAGHLLLDGMVWPEPFDLRSRGRVVIVGGGKAAAGMAAGVVEMLVHGGVARDRVTGLVSVPEGCGRRVPGVEIRETRPAARNLPTHAAVTATREILVLLETLAQEDIVFAVVSGGGSALLAAPRSGVPLHEKIALAGFLAAAGADITEINRVRQAASDVKGGGLARACAAGRMLALVLSDVIGDPLEAIASGPCMPTAVSPVEVLDVLERYGAVAANVAPQLVGLLRDDLARTTSGGEPLPCSLTGSWTTPRGCRVDHLLLGSNATAVHAAAEAASRYGYAVTIRQASPGVTETADDVGHRLARAGFAVVAATQADGQPRAIVEGGEAVVRLPADHGVGGRNQQTVASALAAVLADGGTWPAGLALASIGTDGEDGPTHAAGGAIDAAVATRATSCGLDVTTTVARFDALPFLEAADGLVVTGPTGTNVADLRIVLASTREVRLHLAESGESSE